MGTTSRRGAGESEGFDAAGGEDLGQAGGVSERIGRPGNARGFAEAAFEILLAVEEMTGEGFGVGEIGVGLDDRSADGIPPPRFHILFDAGEGGGIGAFDMLVNNRFAADEGEFFVLVHEIENGAAGDDAFVQAFAPVPEPDGIEMGVGDEMEGEVGHGEDW